MDSLCFPLLTDTFPHHARALAFVSQRHFSLASLALSPFKVLRYENLPQFIRKKTIPKNKLAIFFFGTRDYTWVQASDLKPYNEQNQSLAGKVAKTNKKFADALEEVEDMGVRALYTANYLAMAADEQPHVATELVAESRKTVEEVAPKKKAGSALGKRKSIAESPATERKKSKTATGASSSSSKASML